MRKTVMLLSVLAFIAGCSASRVVKEDAISIKQTAKVESKYKGPKRRVAVLNFSNKTAYGQRLSNVASDILVTELNKTGNYIIIERERLDKILEEQKLGLSGVLDSNSAVTVGNLLGASAVILGSITDFGVKTESGGMIITQGKKQTASATVDVRVVDVETGRVIFTDSGKGLAEKSTGTLLGIGSSGGYDETLEGEALRAAIVKLTENIVSQINMSVWTCQVAEVAGEKIYIDAGRASGLEKGAVFNVFSPGKEIVSPSTNLVIGREEKKNGKVRVVDFFGEDGAIVEKIEGIVAKGDFCKTNE